jgi:hypothetical protein
MGQPGFRRSASAPAGDRERPKGEAAQRRSVRESVEECARVSKSAREHPTASMNKAAPRGPYSPVAPIALPLAPRTLPVNGFTQ